MDGGTFLKVTLSIFQVVVALLVLCCSQTLGLIHVPGNSPVATLKRNVHAHDHNHDHTHGEGQGTPAEDLIDFAQRVGVRVVDGKDREGAEDLGNDLDFLAHHDHEKELESLRKLFLSGIPLGQLFTARPEDLEALASTSTTPIPTAASVSTIRLPIKDHAHWLESPTELIIENEQAMPIFNPIAEEVRARTTIKPEYLTETQYYFPETNTEALNSHIEEEDKSSAKAANVTEVKVNAPEQISKPIIINDRDLQYSYYDVEDGEYYYYDDDYYNYNDENETEVPTVTRKPRSSEDFSGSPSRIGRKILSAEPDPEPEHLHMSEKDMEHMMMMMLHNAVTQVEMEDSSFVRGRKGRPSPRRKSKNFRQQKKQQKSGGGGRGRNRNRFSGRNNNNSRKNKNRNKSKQKQQNDESFGAIGESLLPPLQKEQPRRPQQAQRQSRTRPTTTSAPRTTTTTTRPPTSRKPKLTRQQVRLQKQRERAQRREEQRQQRVQRAREQERLRKQKQEEARRAKQLEAERLRKEKEEAEEQQRQREVEEQRRKENEERKRLQEQRRQKQREQQRQQRLQRQREQEEKRRRQEEQRQREVEEERRRLEQEQSRQQQQQRSQPARPQQQRPARPTTRKQTQNQNSLPSNQGPRKSSRRGKALNLGSNSNNRIFRRPPGIPVTNFNCADFEFHGWYADMETDCEVFHMCHANGRVSSFKCPQGTAFDQRLMVCNWKKKVKCHEAPEFFPTSNR